VDVNYTMFFPLQEIYTSLYARIKSGTEQKGKHSNADRSPPMWKVVEEAMNSGTLQSLREGRARPSTHISQQIQTARRNTARKTTVRTNTLSSVQPAPERRKEQRVPAEGRARVTPASTKGDLPQNRRERRKEAASAAIRAKNDSDDDETGAAFFE